MTIATSTLGRTGPTVSRIGLGTMGMSGMYGVADEDEAIATIQAALDAGVDLIDTGDFYGSGHNEALLHRALVDRPREDYVLSVKYGGLRDPAGGWGGNDISPAATRNFLAYSLQRLGVDHIDVYRPARFDGSVPIEDTVGAIAEMIDAGYVRHIGLSEVGAGTIRRAHAVHPIADVQIEYSLLTRGIEDAILPTCRELGIGVTAYGVLSRGLLSDTFRGGHEPAAGDFRAWSPRFQGANLRTNLALVDALAAVADGHGMTVAQLAIAWVLAQGDDIIPVIGARRVIRLDEALGALAIELTPDEIAAIEAAAPATSVAGARYAEAQFAHLDSER